MTRTGAKSLRVRGIASFLTATPFVGFLIALLSWPFVSPMPAIGPDASWNAGLYMGLADGLQFGREFVFTYGPLGFLQRPALYDEGLWVVAVLYRGAIQIALAIVLLWAARRAMPFLAAVALTYSLLAVGYLDAGVGLLTLVFCLGALGNSPQGAGYVVAIAGGAVAAIELLGKLNLGIEVFLICALTAAAMGGRGRWLTMFAATFALAFVGLWLVAGQGLAGLPDFVSNSVEILGGYSRAMPTELSDVAWAIPFALASIAALTIAAVVATRQDELPRQVGTVAIVVVFCFLTFKQSFVRQGLGNGSDFFPLMLGAAVGLLCRLPVRVRHLPPYAPAVALAVPIAALAIAALPNPSLWASLQPDDHIAYFRDDALALASSGERAEIAAVGRRRMRSAYALDPAALRLLRSTSVDVEPWEIGVAWAYSLDWHPLPVIQGYQAYTPELDALNADALSSPIGPETILRQNTAEFAGAMDSSIDGRNAAWDPPAAARAMLCGYRELHATRRWQVLGKTQDRCSSSRRVRTVRTETDRAIRIPVPRGPDEIVFARIEGAGVDGLEGLRSVLYRARKRTIAVDGKRRWRLVPDTATDGLILAAGSRADFAPPFSLAPDAKSFSIHIEGAPSRSLAATFFEQTVSPPGKR